MREIKFMVWFAANKLMIGPYNLEDEALPLTLSIDTPLQYTGLKDKNGKEIYDGDLIKAKSGKVFVVSWDESSAGYYPFGICGDYQEYSSDVEIIGNVYQNPELLK